MKYLFLLLPFLASCSSMSEREKALHVTHLIDVAQTYQIYKSPCHWEDNALTKAFIGEHPDPDNIILWAFASSVAYHYAEKYLPDTVMGVSFALKVGTIKNNNEIGLMPSGYRCQS